MTEALPDAIDVRLPSDLAVVRPFRKMLEALLLAQGWTEESVEDATLVATEVVQNAIEHGSKADGGERVSVRIAVSADGLDLEVADPGTGRDPRILLARDVTRPPDTESARGRGLYLIHTLSARFERLIRTDGGCLIRVHLVPEPA